VFDQYDVWPGQDVLRFMERGVASDRVVIILTPTYAAKATNRSGGVGYENLLITAEIFASSSEDKFIPVLRGDIQTSFPAFLKSKVWVDMREGASFDRGIAEILRGLRREPACMRPEKRPNAPTSVTTITNVVGHDPAVSGAAIKQADVIAFRPDQPLRQSRPYLSYVRILLISVLAAIMVGGKIRTSTIEREPTFMPTHGVPSGVLDKLVPLLTTYEGIDQPSIWPGGDSGITIGLGYDLSQVTLEQFRRDWSLLEGRTLASLSRAVGIRGGEAALMAQQYKNIHIQRDDAVRVFSRAQALQDYAQAEQTFPGIQRLPPPAQAALVSLVYNQGMRLGGEKRREVALIHDAVLTKNLREVAKQFRSLSRSAAAAHMRGLAKRRESEAELVESAL
jgi:GH24 family phage-related lysozyme (muramidase)